MKRVIAVLLGVTATLFCYAQDFDKVKMDSLFKIVESNNLGMNSISIFHEGKEVYQNSIGFANMEKSIPNSNQTLFRIGSISKTFTAVMIMRMVELGALSLDDKLAEYFPGFDHADKISIEDLLRHSSGIFNFTGADDFQSWMFDELDRQELIDKIISYGSVFDPGTKAEYSNSNYVILTFILEDVSGRTYDDLLQEMICIPCGLQYTYLGTSLERKPLEAYSYYFSESWQLFPPTDLSIPLGAGAIISTASELNQFWTCLFSHSILNSTSLEKMKSEKFGYGIGMFSSSIEGLEAFGHNGAIDAFTADATYYPDLNLSIAITCNGLGDMDQDVILEGVTKIYFGLDYELPRMKEPIQMELSELENYIGTYSSSTLPLKISVFTNTHGLAAQAEGQDPINLSPLDPHTFVFRPAGIEMIFDPDSGKMILNQGGDSYVYEKEE